MNSHDMYGEVLTSLIRSLVNRKYKKHRMLDLDPAIELEDLVHEGIVACLEKQETYDETKGAYSTWVNIIADQAIRDFLRQGTTVPVTQYGQDVKSDTTSMIYPDQYDEDEDQDFWEKLTNKSYEYLEDKINNAELHYLLVDALTNDLKYPDDQLLAYNFGLFSLGPIPLRDLESMFNIPRNTIHRRLNRALAVLSKNPKLQKVWDQLDIDPDPIHDDTKFKVITGDNKHRN